MNSTTTAPVVLSIFSSGQKILYVISSAVVLLVATLVYRVLKRPIRDEEETYDQRTQFISYIMIACLLGIQICVALPHALLHAELGTNFSYTAYALAAFGILIGFNVLLTVQRCVRVHHPNKNYRQSGKVSENIEPLINRDTIEIQEAVKVKDMGKLFSSHVSVMDKVNDLYNRRLIAAILYILLSFMTALDGFFVVYWSDKTLGGNLWVLVVMACIVRFAYGTCVSCVLAHSMLHALVKSRWYHYLIDFRVAAFLYFVIQVLSALPLLLDVTVDVATGILQHPAFTFFYGVNCGMMLWVLGYFVWIQDAQPTRVSTTRYLLLVWFITIALGITGLFV